MRTIYWLSCVAAFNMLWLPGCGSRVYEAGDSNSNWLQACDPSVVCGSGLACLCGVCTVECTEDSACGSRLPASCETRSDCNVSAAVCFPASVDESGDSTPPGDTDEPEASEAPPWESSSLEHLPDGETVTQIAERRPTALGFDRDGVMWATGCQGLHAITPQGIRYYRAGLFPIPHRPGTVAVDDQNRKWIANGKELAVLDGDVWRSLFKGYFDPLSVSPDGTAWLNAEGELLRIDHEGITTATTSPGEVTSIAAETSETAWASTSEGIFYHSGDTWLGPVGVPSELAWSASAGWALAAPTLGAGGLYRVRATSTGLELEQLADAGTEAQGTPLGFTAGREWVFDRSGAVNFLSESGMLIKSLNSENYRRPALDPSGAVWQPQANGIVKLGDEENTTELPVVAFDRATLLPWRAQGYAAAVEDEAVDVSIEDLRTLPSGLAGKKIHFTGALGGGFERQCVRIDGEDVALYNEFAESLGPYLAEHPLTTDVPLSVSCDDPDAQLEQVWDFYAYVETGDCFQSTDMFDIASSPLQLWVVEAYPSNLSAQDRADMKAELKQLP